MIPFYFLSVGDCCFPLVALDKIFKDDWIVGLDKEIVKSCVLEVLNLTKLRVLHSEMLCKSELIVEDIARRDWDRALEEGWHWKEEDLCRFESSAKEWISEAVAWRRSFIKRKNRVGERTEPWGTPLETGKDAEVAPSTTTDIKRLDKKLEMSLHKEGVKP